MKSIKYLAIAIAAICLTACGSDGITPTSKKVNGPLGKFFEVVDRDYKIKDGQLNVELKRVNEGGPTDASWSSEPTFTVELIDEDDNVISSESTSVVSSKEQLESVFSLGVDESTSISFKFNETDGAVKFKVSSKWSDAEESVSNVTSQELLEEETTEDGDYKWLSQRLVTEDDLYGLSTDELSILRNAIFAMHGYKFKRDDLRSFFSKFSWYNGTKSDVSSELNSVEQKNVNFIKAHENGSSTVSYTESDYEPSGSGWDEYLDQYERYVNKYISYVKKAANGDLEALAEYPSLMQEAERLSKKIENAKGSLTSAQWSRYNKINMKMLDAMQ